MLANLEDLALIMTAEQGKPLAESRGEVRYGASFEKWWLLSGSGVVDPGLGSMPGGHLG